MNNIICGILKARKKIYFSFNTGTKILTIQPSKMSEFPSFIPQNDFDDFSLSKERMNISGETNSRNYIEFIDVKFSSIGRGCFQAWVPAYIIGKANALSFIPKPTSIKHISFKGECIDRFMTSKQTVSDDWDYRNNKLQINIDYGKDKIKKFNYNNLEFSLVPGWNMISAQKDVNLLLTMQTTLNIKSKKKMNVKAIIELYKKVEKLFSFICYRQHVNFDSIILTQIEPVIFDKVPEDTAINFELHVSSDDNKYDLPNVGQHMILRDYSVNNIPSLIKCLEEDEHMLLSFPNNSLKANIIDNKDWNWFVGFNIGKNKNKITDIDAEYVSYPGSSYLGNTVIQEGKSLGLIYGYKTDGIFQTQEEVNRYEALNPDQPYQEAYGRKTMPGDLKYVDLSGDGYVNKVSGSTEDKTVIGVPGPILREDLLPVCPGKD